MRALILPLIAFAICSIAEARVNQRGNTEVANAIFLCRMGRIDPTYINPNDPDALRVEGPMVDLVVGFHSVGSELDRSALRVYDPSHILESDDISTVVFIPQSQQFLIRTVESGGRTISLVITTTGRSSGRSSFPAVAVRTPTQVGESPLSYMFNGHCSLQGVPELGTAFDALVSALRARQP